MKSASFCDLFEETGVKTAASREDNLLLQCRVVLVGGVCKCAAREAVVQIFSFIYFITYQPFSVILQSQNGKIFHLL